ncbi:MAG TPA: tetratricopeptide repeat protein [Burkholderiales bacterium]|nr:tetratricopeptide repeat protein [Burkholderiales bacterium]
MPILVAVTFLIQMCFAFHALKTGRPYWWLFVIMGFPVAGCVLYYFVEVFPSSRESRRAEKAVRSIVKSFDPDKELRARVADLEACGSVDNRVALARECTARGLHAEAAALYRSCLAGVHEQDPDLRYGLASALLEAGAFEEARSLAQGLRERNPGFRVNDVRLALACSLEALGRVDEALAEYHVLADTYPGEEARWRYGALLERAGRAAEARGVFERMLRNAERMPGHYREAQGEWLSRARQGVQA